MRCRVRRLGTQQSVMFVGMHTSRRRPTMTVAAARGIMEAAIGAAWGLRGSIETVGQLASWLGEVGKREGLATEVPSAIAFRPSAVTGGLQVALVQGPPRKRRE